MSDVVGLGAGDVLETAMLSPVVGGQLRTWTDQGARLWEVVEPERLATTLGMGVVARTEVEPGRFREVGMLSESGSLLLPSRMVRGQEAAEGGLFALQPAEAEVDVSAAWPEFATWLGVVAVAAARRGDFLVVEAGGWDHKPERYALFACLERDGVWLSHLEASPAPLGGNPPWPVPPENLEGASVTGPASERVVAGAGYALAVAASEWVRSPLDLAVTFGRSPGGPNPLGDGDERVR